MNQFSSVQIFTITAQQAEQRLDNFLFTLLKGVPKSRVYNLLRKGEVRVNKKRKEASYRLQEGDLLRIPPIRVAEKVELKPSDSLKSLIKKSIIFENDHLMILNKPSGIPVHAGSEVQIGVIEALRAIFPEYPAIQLVHRLDKETSGCLLVAKDRATLLELQKLLIEGMVSKTYLALVQGGWRVKHKMVELSLQKGQQVSGERKVRVDEEGKESATEFTTLAVYSAPKAASKLSLVKAKLFTGRTHQIRVHAEYCGHPLVGDEKYGKHDFNKVMRVYGLKRLFLHAQQLVFKLPSSGQEVNIQAPLPGDLQIVLDCLEKEAG